MTPAPITDVTTEAFWVVESGGTRVWVETLRMSGGGHEGSEIGQPLLKACTGQPALVPMNLF